MQSLRYSNNATELSLENFTRLKGDANAIVNLLIICFTSMD